MNVRKILKRWLKDNGYDGLCNQLQCGCTIDDMGPCNVPLLCCKPGYKGAAPSGEIDGHEKGVYWIYENKAEAEQSLNDNSEWFGDEKENKTDSRKRP